MDFAFKMMNFGRLFGGYSAYDHTICSRLFSLPRIERWSAQLYGAPHIAACLGGKELIIAADFKLDKLFTLNVNSGTYSGKYVHEQIIVQFAPDLGLIYPKQIPRSR